MIKRYSCNEINEVICVLENDGVVSVPTDTVFGLCARISSSIAYDKLVKVKNRPLEKSFPIMCANVEQILSVAVPTDVSRKLIDSFMPGPITLVLKKKNGVADYITNGKDTIAIRMATSKVLEDILLSVGPVFMTSANQSGEPACTNLDEIEDCCPLIDGMLEGDVVFSCSSTIVDCTNGVKILRTGPISLDDINNVIS
jgi:L-threonylcarbamoyladenylate synthase